VIGKFSEGNKEAIGETGVLVRVPRIEAARLDCARSEEVEECGRRLLGDGLAVNRVVKVGQRVLGVGGGAEWGPGCLRLGWRPTGFLSTGGGNGVSLCLLSPRQLNESNKWVHTFILELDSASRLGFRRSTKVGHNLTDLGLRGQRRVGPRVSVLDFGAPTNPPRPNKWAS
jgi:hypothetical protein